MCIFTGVHPAEISGSYTGTTTDIDTDAISAKIESFRVLLSKLVTNNNFKDGTLTYYLSELSKYKDKFTNVKDAVSALNDTVDSFQGISAKTISVRDIQTVMSNVETCVKKMNEIIQNDFVNDIGGCTPCRNQRVVHLEIAKK